ncbi:MAG TPA: leishmanolysin-related zinc metalloendopeptidase [Gemmatimonadales bacterium]|nr:leishmanolysin-related zinc metalloendopeptidase [Gemmatimonadales bacterium]
MRRGSLLPLVIATMAAACSEPTVITIVLTPGSITLNAIGATQQITATLTDQDGKPVTGVTVTWTSADPTIASVSSSGLVRAEGAGSTSVTASVGTSSSAQTSVTVSPSNFEVELRNLTTLNAPQQRAFDEARTRWRQIIIGDVPDILLVAAAGTCGSNSPAINETVDDLVILVTVEPIDGVGGTLGSAGPCYIRNSNQLPILGRMRFDRDDLNQLEATGRLNDVILHEMGHVLGFGTLWTNFGYLENPSLPSNPGADTHFDGPQAIAAFNQVGGSSYTGGAKVPVENTQGGAGTRDSHWRESVMDEELMTGFIESLGINPLSRVSLASMQDLGYEVNLARADPYQKIFLAPPAGAASSGPERQIWLGDDIHRGPLRAVGSRGEVVRVIRR